MLTLKQIAKKLAYYHPPQGNNDLERQAAVAMLLRDNDGDVEVLLIKRAEHDNDPWSGDLGFPGGRIEKTDLTPRAAAERETWEEVGLQLTKTNYLGQSGSLTGAYLSVHVSCFVYQIAKEADFKLNGEVVDFFWAPFKTLLEPQRNQQHVFFYRGRHRKHPVIKLDEWSNRPLWGITYRLLDNFLCLFNISFTHPERREKTLFSTKGTKMNQETRLINLPESEQNDTVPPRTINPPTYRGSTVLFNSYKDLTLANSGEYKGICYGTDRLPTQRLFEAAVRTLEEGSLTRAFPSGISAITNTLLALTQAGDHILVCDNVYGPTARFCREILTRYNIVITFIPPTVGKNVEQFLQNNTKLIFLESPGSNTFEIQDIPEITALARKKNIITVLDNTWATPLYLDAFSLGIDISIQSATKYITGHSDMLLGTVTTTAEYSDILQHFYRVTETYVPEEDCYNALRGLKTLPLRLRQHEQSALKIAQWLESHPCVDQVLHPALASHPEHHLWKRDFSGSSGLFAFTFKQEPSEKRLASFINALQLFGIGYSWGGFKSLVTAAKYARLHPSRYAGRNVLRLNIGLEDPQDLQDDIASAFNFLN